MGKSNLYQKPKVSIDDKLRRGNEDEAITDGNLLRLTFKDVKNLAFLLKLESRKVVVDIEIAQLNRNIAETLSQIKKYEGVSNYPTEIYNELIRCIKENLSKEHYERLDVNESKRE